MKSIPLQFFFNIKEPFNVISIRQVFDLSSEHIFLTFFFPSIFCDSTNCEYWKKCFKWMCLRIFVPYKIERWTNRSNNKCCHWQTMRKIWIFSYQIAETSWLSILFMIFNKLLRNNVYRVLLFHSSDVIPFTKKN